MVRIWEYVEPGDDGVTPVVIRWDDDEIIENYWEYWKSQMIRVHGPNVVLSQEQCIEDWRIVNWAYQVFNWDVE